MNLTPTLPASPASPASPTSSTPIQPIINTTPDAPFRDGSGINIGNQMVPRNLFGMPETETPEMHRTRGSQTDTGRYGRTPCELFRHDHEDESEDESGYSNTKQSAKRRKF